jgi:hypothetical protein
LKRKDTVLGNILSAYGVLTLTFLLFFLLTSFCPYLCEWRPLAPVFLTAFSIFLLDMVRIHYQRAKIEVSRISHYKFEESIRICAKVENRGRSVARYVKPILTIEDENLTQLVYAKYSDFDKKWLPCSKDGSICTICDENSRGFLCPFPFKVEKNYLCWTVPEVEAGVGLNNRRYCHVTNIAPGDSQEVILGDVYRSEEEKSCVIKFADEYGIDWKPRICYKIHLEKSAIIRFTLELVGEGFDPIEEKVELKISRDELKVVFKGSEVPIPMFKDIRSFPIRYTPAGIC